MPSYDSRFRNRVALVGGLKIGNSLESFKANGQTTDATQKTLGTYTPADATAINVKVQVVGRKSDGSQAAGYLLEATFRRSGSTTTQVGSTTAVATHEDDASWDATLDASGTDVRVRVTGKASTTIDWTAVGMAAIAPGS